MTLCTLSLSLSLFLSLPLSFSLSLSLPPSLPPSLSPPCRLSELVRLVSDGLDCEFSSEADRLDYGNRLKSAIANFTVDFIPHMNEEEEVCVCLQITGSVETGATSCQAVGS